MDLAEQVEDFIPVIQSRGDSEMDSLIMFIFILLILSLLLLWLGRFLYQKYKDRKIAATATDLKTTTGTTVPGAIGATGTPVTSSLLAQKATGALSAAPKSSGGGFATLGGSRGREFGAASKSKSQSSTSLASGQNPGIRKRLTRKSPGPDVQRRSRSIPPPSNVSGPDDTTSTWTSHVFKWLYSDLVIVNDLLYGWITSLNQTMARNSNENGILVEVVRVLPESTPPNITNIFCDKSNAANVSEVVITFDVETTIVLQVKGFRQIAGKADVLHYRATVTRFKGHLSIAMNFQTLIGEMRIEGYPEVKINIASIGPIKSTGKEETEIQDMISEVLNLSIRDTQYPVDFSIHSTCPRALKMESDSFYDQRGAMDFPNPFDYMDGRDNTMPYDQRATNSSHMQQSMSAGKRLLVKIVKGEGLSHAKDPYCVVEMDEPPQKNQTGARQGVNPYWDEHFLFDLSNQSSEILFEIYDRPVSANDYPKFLGLGLVGIDELAVGPSSSQIIGLQPRPYETDPVFGAINVEFVFIEGAQVPVGRRPYKLKEALKLEPHQQEAMMYAEQQQSKMMMPSNQMSPMRQQLQQHPQQQSPYMNNGNDHRTMNPNSITSSSTSHDSHSLRPINNQYSSQQPMNANKNNSAVTNGNKSPYPYHQPINNNNNGNNSLSPNSAMTMTQTTTGSPLKPNSNNLNMKISLIKGNEANKLGSEPISPELSDRGRDRKRTGIFGTLRKRLSKSKTRNGDANGTNGYADSRSVSADRGLNSTLPIKSPTGTMKSLGYPNSSRRSSISEMSGISGLSTMSSKTFLHESSSLVLEVVENGVKRHYLVPMSIAQKPRWRRKGTKLHVYNDHTFIAKHLPGGLICEICMQSIPRRVGKQGYECRDCQLKCHKQCHVRTSQICPKPSIQSIELCQIKEESDTAIRKL